MRTLKGRTVALLESRQRSELASLVERLGGTPLSAPAVSEQPSHEDAGPVLRRLLDGAFEMVIALTGAGVTALFKEAERRGLVEPVRTALARVTIACRGPKPQAALKRYELAPAIVTNKPHTTNDLLEALTATPLAGVPVLLLHYGERNAAFSAALVSRGADLDDVCLYEWALPEDLAPLHDVVARVIAGQVDVLLVTSQVQFRFLLQIAAAAGTADALVNALRERVIVGAVGPVCASALRAGGVVPDVLPAAPNSASLVGAVADYFELTAQQEDP
jgi:uroporphyrinogen-III synthase